MNDTRTISDTEAKRILEALLLVSDKPLLLNQAKEVLGSAFEATEIRRFLSEMAGEYQQANRGIRILEVAEGFQLVTDPELYSYVTRLIHRVRAVRLSRPSLETLAIIAYRQPMTRIEIEQVRGVDASGVLDTLLKFNLIRVIGRKEVVGRPLLYGTTREFLAHFGLKNLDDLPSLEELKGLSKEAQKPVLAREDGGRQPSEQTAYETTGTGETNYDAQSTSKTD